MDPRSCTLSMGLALIDSWWTPQDVVIDTYSHQQLILHHVLMELEHVLARDLVLTVAGSSDGKAYVQRRLVITIWWKL